MPSDKLKIALHYALPKTLINLLAGYLANVKIPFIKNRLIQYFIRTYEVNMQEASEERPEAYAHFNAFFIRHLKPTCRPIANTAIISPVDGSISEMGRVQQGTLLQAKGIHYTVHELLGTDTQQSALFEKGLYATLYLSPKDYHRVHMPMDATLKEMIHIPGKLFSVQPATTRAIPRLFARNERLVVFFETAFGPMAMVLVGATIVGAIGTAWHGDLKRGKTPRRFVYNDTVSLKQAAEMGYFKLGSTVILLFANHDHLAWLPSLEVGNTIRFGEPLGVLQ